MKHLKLYEELDLYPGFTTTSTDGSIDYRLDDIQFPLEELLELFDKYENDFSKDYDIEKLEKNIKNDIDIKLFKKMNLGFFFKSLLDNLTISNENALNFFNEYKKSIHRRYKKIFDNNFSNYQNSELKKLKDIKSKSKNKYSYNLLDIESPALYEELTKMVLWVKDNNKKLLISFDGRDTGGKGSISRFILKNFFAAPLGRNVLYKDFGVPTKWEQRNWFHRYMKSLPQNGQIVLFDRSWWNRAVNDPVMGYCTLKQYEKFMENVLSFEQSLIDNDIIHIKFWLSIDKETQLNRFDLRKSSPIKFWKFSENDLKSIEKWDDFTPYINKMLKNTSTNKMPWVVVNMDDKPLGWLNSLRYILNKVPYSNKNEKILKVYPEIVYEIK